MSHEQKTARATVELTAITTSYLLLHSLTKLSQNEGQVHHFYTGWGFWRPWGGSAMTDYAVPANPPYVPPRRIVVRWADKRPSMSRRRRVHGGLPKKKETGRIPSLFFPAPAGAGYVITWLALPVPLVPLEPLAPPLPAWLLSQS